MNHRNLKNKNYFFLYFVSSCLEKLTHLPKCPAPIFLPESNINMIFLFTIVSKQIITN